MPFCGLGLWGLCFLVVAGILSIVPGAAAYLLTRRKKPPTGEIAAALATVGAFLLMIFACLAYYEYCANDFDCDRGFDDYYRMPLKYPYQISAFGELEEGCLTIWPDENDSIACGITYYAIEDSIMVGHMGPDRHCQDCVEEWFSFDLDTGRLKRYADKQAFVAACEEFGFPGEPVLRSFDEHFYRK